MAKINRSNIDKKFAEKGVRFLWFRGGYKTAYYGHYRFQYTQVGTNGIDLYNLFHDLAHAVDFVSLGKLKRLKIADFDFDKSFGIKELTQSEAFAMVDNECRTAATQFILMRHFDIVKTLDHFLRVEKPKFFDLDQWHKAFKDIDDMLENLPDQLNKPERDFTEDDWRLFNTIRQKRDKLYMSKVTDLIRYYHSTLNPKHIVSCLIKLDRMAKNDRQNSEV